jgi:hypothetical protein
VPATARGQACTKCGVEQGHVAKPDIFQPAVTHLDVDTDNLPPCLSCENFRKERDGTIAAIREEARRACMNTADDAQKKVDLMRRERDAAVAEARELALELARMRRGR